MSAARPIPSLASDEDRRRSYGDERAGADRRSGDRRAPTRPFDPLFALTLICQVKPFTDLLARSPYTVEEPLRPCPRRDIRA